jgi:glutathione S-transferase
MESIRLYQIPFSHFCDKVRWTLDFYSIPYETINYAGSRTPGLEKAPKTLRKLTPIIEDPNNEGLFISDSTPILLYLDEHYGKQKTLFPCNTIAEKEMIVQYCLKLDSQLGLYARRLAYLHIISEKPAILSVFMGGKFDKTSFDDWKSYFYGLIGSCFVIGRLGIERIKEEQIFEKTISILEEIQNDLRGKDYLFNNQFTAADLTLTALIRPLRLVTPLMIKYKSLFDYADRIRERHDPKKIEESNILRLLTIQRQKKQSNSFIRNSIFKFFYFLFYPIQILINMNEKNKPLLQYPSTNLNEEANNDVRQMKLNSFTRNFIFFIRNLYCLWFILPIQMDFVNQQGNKILNRH